MAYTKEQLLSLGVNNLSDARGKIVTINIFDNIDDIKLSPNVYNSMQYTLEMYNNYLKLFYMFSKTNREKIFKALKDTEVIDNHCVEQENYDLLLTYNENHHSTAINYLIKKLIVENKPLDDFIIRKTYEILMRGTSNENQVTIGYRKNNNFFVGYYENNENVALYYPISYDDIKQAIAIFCSYYNNKIISEDQLFIKPFIIHGLLATLQVFEDGNTRFARTIQHIKLFELTLLLLDNSLNLPPVYFSKTYIPYRYQYRDLITQIAINPSHENWNNWISFNLRRLQDQLFFNEEQLNRTRKL